MTKFSISRHKLVFFISMILVLSAFVAGYLIIQRNAEKYVRQLIEYQSDGKLKFQVDKVRFNLLKLSLEFQNPVLHSQDTATIETGYHIKAKSLSVKVHTLLPLLNKTQLVVDSVVVQSPEITVNRYRIGLREKVSIPEEMNLIYLSLRKVLAFIKLEKMRIDAAKIVINDLTKPGSLPVVLSKINLVIDKANDAQGASDERFLLADRILLEVYDQDITSSNGFNRLKFKRLRLNTLTRTIRLDSCFIAGNSSSQSGAAFNTFVDTLRITNIDFNALVKESKVKVDSAFCVNPEVNFMVRPHGEGRTRKSLHQVVAESDSLDLMLKKMLGDLDIGYLEVKNAKVKITTPKGDKTKTFQTDKSNFSLTNFLVSSDPSMPIYLERFNLHLLNYKSYSPDSLYVVAFDEIQVLNRVISLINFRIGPTRDNLALLSREIKMAAFEFNDIDWLQLLYESRIVAGNAVLVKPELHFRLPEEKKRLPEENTNPLVIMQQLRGRIQVEGLFVRDGTLSLDIRNKKHIAVNHLNAHIDVNRLLQAENRYRIADALDTLFFSRGEFSSPEFSLTLTDGGFSSRNRSLRFRQLIQENSNKSLSVKVDDLAVDGFYMNSPDSILVKYLHWGMADILANTLVKQSDTSITKRPVMPILMVGSMAGGDTYFDLRGKTLHATTRFNRISTDKLVVDGAKIQKISNLFLDGQFLHWRKGEVRGDIAEFVLQDQGSSALNNLEINLPVNEETAFLNIPRVLFTADLTRIIAGDLSLESMEVQRPVISFLPRSGGTLSQGNPSSGEMPKLNIGRLNVSQPTLIGLPKAMSGKMQLNTGRSDWNFVGIHSDSALLSIDTLRFATSRPFFSNSRISLLPTGLEKVEINGSNIHYQPGIAGGKPNWSLLLDAVKTSGFDFNSLNGDSVEQHVVLRSLNLSNLGLNSLTVANLTELVNSNHHFSISEGNLLLENGNTRLEALNFTLDQSANSFSLDSLAFSPVADRDAFLKEAKYRRSYLQLYTGLVQVKELNFDQILRDSVFHSGNIAVNNLRLHHYVDKRLPFQHGIEKPMLTELFQKIKTRFAVDSLLLKNSEIVAEEINDKTLLPGSIQLTRIRGAITGIRNYNFSSGDDFRFNLYTRFMDATDLRVNYQQSYTDSLSTFNLKAIASSFDLTALNPMLQPLASAKVKSGYLDTLRMSVVGRKYVAFGVMKMHYHNLNVQYLNQGSEAKPTTKTKFITFFANSIVRRQRLLGSGEVYAERDPERGFVNYWVKIFIGGVLTNTGVKSNKKQEKRYESTIKKHQVPSIPNIPVDY